MDSDVAGLPPPPPGFTLDTPQTPQPPIPNDLGGVPAPPPGFKLDQPTPDTAIGGDVGDGSPPEAATAYVQKLHKEQEAQYAPAPAPTENIPSPPPGFKLDNVQEVTPGQALASTPAPSSPHSAITRGLVSGLLEQNPTLGAEALEGLSHLAPDSMKESLINGSFKLRDIAALNPAEFKTQSKGFLESIGGGFGPAMTWAGETLGSGVASMAPTFAAGLGGAGIGGAAGFAVGGPFGAGVGAPAGAFVGAGSASFFLNYGEVYQALKEAGVDPKLSAEYAGYAALPMAALDTVSVGPLITRLGGLSEVKREAARAIARRIAAEGGKSATREGVTEAAQEAIKVATVSMAADQPFWTLDNVDAIVGSGVGGAIVGGTVGGIVGTKRDRVQGRPPSEAELHAALTQIGGDTSPPPRQEALRVQASAMVDQPKWYYSEVRKVAEAKLPKEASSEQILATIRNSPGVKQEELEALGLPQWLSEQGGKVNKADVISHIESNAVDVQEVTKREVKAEPIQWAPVAGTPHETYVDQYDQIRIQRQTDSQGAPIWVLSEGANLGSRTEWISRGQFRDRPQAEHAAQRLSQSMTDYHSGGAEYAKYTVPGGENYREVLLTLPRRPPNAAGLSENFESPHFDESNVLAHTRLTDRQTPDGKKVLFVEEIQSDWHQKGREYGYRTDVRPQWEAGPDGSRVIPNSSVSIRPAPTKSGEERWLMMNRAGHQYYLSEEEAMHAGELAYQRLHTEAPPNAPFKTSWPELVVKRIMRLAADEGYSQVSWASGEDQNERGYNLDSRQQAGQREFYDNILPRLMKKWGEKLGGRFGRTQINTHNILGATKYLDRGAVDVTPAMQTRVQVGLPLFTKTFESGPVRIEESQAFGLASKEDRITMMRQASRAVAVAIGQVARRMGMNIPIVFKLKNLEGNAIGLMRTMGDPLTREVKEYWIELDAGAHDSLETVYATVSHEFGHIIEAHFFSKAPASTKLLVRHAWAKWRQSLSSDPTLAETLQNRDNFINQLFNKRRVQGDGGPLFDRPTEQVNYWLSFEEWFAEQTARWMTTAERPLSVVDRFFSSLAKRVRTLYDVFRQKFGYEAKPDDHVASFLDHLLVHTNVSAMQIVEAAENALISENIASMRADSVEDWPGSPGTPASIPLRTLASHAATPPAAKTALKVSAAAVDHFNRFYNLMLGMVHLADRNLHIAPLQRYRELWQIKQLERAKIMDGAYGTIKAWRKLNLKQQDAISKLIDEYMNMTYLTPQEVQQGIVRKPNKQEFSDLVRNAGVDNNGLEVFQKVTKDFDDMLTRYADVMFAEAQKISDPVDQALKIHSIATQVAEIRKRPYFPAMHFGDLTLTVKDAAGNVMHFETFESEGKRKLAERTLQTRLKPGETIQKGALPKSARPFLGLPRGLLELVEQKLNLSPQQQDALQTLKFELAPAHSFKHRFQVKSYVPGYSRDFMRAYANFFFHGSNYLTNVKYVDMLREQVSAIQKSSETMLDGTKRMMIRNYVNEHLEYSLDPRPDWAALRGLASLWYLGWSPVTAAINLSQMAIGSYPFLASKFGDVATAKHLTIAGTRLSTYYRRQTLAQMTERELRAISEGVKEGVITEAMAPELAAYSEGRNLKGFGGNLLQEGLTRFTEMAMKMFEMTEQINRRITFRAAFNLASDQPNSKFVQEAIQKHKLQFDRLKSEGWTDHDASAFVAAKDVVESTQYIYQPYAQPRFMRGKLRTIFVFKTFLMNTLFMLWNYPQAAWRSVLVMGLLGGLMGLPGADDLKGIIKALAYRLFGKDVDLEDEARRVLVDHGANADLVLHGMSRYGFGWPLIAQHLGIPLPTVDMSRSMSMGNILPFDVNIAFGPSSTKDTSRAIAETSQRASGAVFGTLFNLYRAVSDSQLDITDAKRWERVLPRAAQGVSRSWRAFSEGRERDRNGNTVIRYDITDPVQTAEALSLALGFQPLRLTSTWDRRFAEMEAVQYWNLRRETLMRQLWTARGNSEEYNRVLSSVRNFNQEVAGTPAAGKAITADTIKRSFESRARSQQARESGTPRTRADIPIVRDLQRLYPEAEIDVRRTK